MMVISNPKKRTRRLPADANTDAPSAESSSRRRKSPSSFSCAPPSRRLTTKTKTRTNITRSAKIVDPSTTMESAQKRPELPTREMSAAKAATRNRATTANAVLRLRPSSLKAAGSIASTRATSTNLGISSSTPCMRSAPEWVDAVTGGGPVASTHGQDESQSHSRFTGSHGYGQKSKNLAGHELRGVEAGECNQVQVGGVHHDLQGDDYGYCVAPSQGSVCTQG